MSNKEITFYVDQAGVNEVVYRNMPGIRELEEEHMNRVISQVRAQFFQDFGVVGYFNLEFEYRPVGGKSLRYIPGGKRPVYRIVAEDANTKAILKKNPGWLAKVYESVQL